MGNTFLNRVFNTVAGLIPPNQPEERQTHAEARARSTSPLSPAARRELYAKVKTPPQPEGKFRSDYPKVPIPMGLLKLLGNTPDNLPGDVKDSPFAAYLADNTPAFSKSDLADLAKLEARHVELLRFISDHGDDKAREAFHAQAQTITSHLSDGNHDKARECEHRDKDSFSIDFREKRKAARVQIELEVSKPAQPYFVKALERVAKNADRVSDLIQHDEEAVSKLFSWPFKPTLLLLTIGQLSWRYTDFIPHASGFCPAPSKFAETLGFNL